MSITRVACIVGLALAMFVAPLAVPAQQPARLPRIGTLDYGSASARQHLWEAFRQGLRGLGYIEGETVAFDHRWADGDVERLPALVAELVKLRVDLIAMAGVPAALATIKEML